MALNILDLPTTATGVRMYMVGNVQLKVTGGTDGAVTRVATLPPATRAAVEGHWLNDTEAIEAFHGEFPLF